MVGNTNFGKKYEHFEEVIFQNFESFLQRIHGAFKLIH